MTGLDEIRPATLGRVMDLVESAGISIEAWAKFKGGEAKAATNPKFCYEWAFWDGDVVVLNLWHEDMKEQDGRIFIEMNPQRFRGDKAAWRKRTARFAEAVKIAHDDGLPVRVIVCAGKRRDLDKDGEKASQVSGRRLDPVAWGFTGFDTKTGAFQLTRGAFDPAQRMPSAEDTEDVGAHLTLQEERRYRIHRKLERRSGVSTTVKKIHGFSCQGCGFNFEAVYGSAGSNFIEAHHLTPLAELPEGKIVEWDPRKDFAVLCANCHRMMHRKDGPRTVEALRSTGKLVALQAALKRL